MTLIKRITTRFGLAAMLLATALSAPAAVVTQMGFIVDSSGSIDVNEFNLMKAGYANAFAALPADGTVEISVQVFGTSTSTTAVINTVVDRVVIDSVATRNAVISAINAMTRITGNTPLGTAITAMTNLMKSSSNYSAGIASVINMATDGAPTGPDNQTSTINAAVASRNAGIDALTVEAVGADSSLIDFLRDIVFSPIAGPGTNVGTVLPLNTLSVPNPMTSNPWVLPINSFDDFGPAIQAKVQALVNNVPEPGSLLLVAVAAAAAGAASRRRAAR